MKKEIKTELAPPAIGPYSQGIRAGEFIFLSGQIPIDPSCGRVVEGRIEEQTRQVLMNIRGVLEEEGAGLEDVVKITVYMRNLSHFDRMNRVYGEFFSPPYPARATVGVSALPKGVDIEIDAIAVARSKDG